MTSQKYFLLGRVTAIVSFILGTIILVLFIISPHSILPFFKNTPKSKKVILIEELKINDRHRNIFNCFLPELCDESEQKNTDYIYPTNPKTGKAYSESELEEFDELRKYFPYNDLIPKKLTKVENERKIEKENEFLNAHKSIQSEKFSILEINIYYDFQIKILKDKIEILEYQIYQAKEDNEENQIKEFEKLLSHSIEHLLKLEKEKINKINSILKKRN